MVTEDEEGRGLMVAGQENTEPNQREFKKPLRELLEHAFNALEQAYRDGNLGEYTRLEAEFVKQLGEYWGYRVRKYVEAGITSGSMLFGEKIHLNTGRNTEEITVIKKPIPHHQPTLIIFCRRDRGKESCGVEIEYYPLEDNSITKPTELIASINLTATVKNQSFPHPSIFELGVSGNRIVNFDRTTSRTFIDKEGYRRTIHKTESVGPGSHRRKI